MLYILFQISLKGRSCYEERKDGCRKKLQAFRVDPKLFSSFIEHIEELYIPVYEPGHKTADEQGFRQDVIDLVKDLNVTLCAILEGLSSGYNC